MRYAKLVIGVLALGTLVACPRKDEEEPLTGAEAKEAAEQATWSSQAVNLTSEGIELSTDFTLGEGVEKAAEEMRAFWESQVPCSTVSLERATVTVDYGTLEDSCVWKGRTHAGVHKITVGRAERAGIQVDHEWIGRTDGNVTVNGEATVDWGFSEKTRTVSHALTWEAKGKTMEGSGRRTQSLLDESAGPAGGIRVEGENTWSFDGRTWSLEIEGVEARPQDPLPQAGTYTLTTPRHTLSLSFARVSEALIRVTIAGGERSFSFDVRATGAIEDT